MSRPPPPLPPDCRIRALELPADTTPVRPPCVRSQLTNGLRLGPARTRPSSRRRRPAFPSATPAGRRCRSRGPLWRRPSPAEVAVGSRIRHDATEEASCRGDLLGIRVEGSHGDRWCGAHICPCPPDTPAPHRGGSHDHGLRPDLTTVGPGAGAQKVHAAYERGSGILTPGWARSERRVAHMQDLCAARRVRPPAPVAQLDRAPNF